MSGPEHPALAGHAGLSIDCLPNTMRPLALWHTRCAQVPFLWHELCSHPAADAPADLHRCAAPAGTFLQRLRWAMGAMQILYRSNPLTLPGLTWAQRVLFWESAASNWTAIPAIVMSCMPIV